MTFGTITALVPNAAPLPASMPNVCEPLLRSEQGTDGLSNPKE
jgi:hypothetical protein